jgi:predicted nucleic acid-binding protein
MTVVSDTSPLCYLLLIDLVDLLPALYGQVVIPQVVCRELIDPKSPAIVRSWIMQPPGWLEIHSFTVQVDSELSKLDLGECEAIGLAEQLNASLILLDEREARQIAQKRGLQIIGLLGILGIAANRKLTNFADAIEQLQKTNFYISSQLIQSLLKRYG